MATSFDKLLEVTKAGNDDFPTNQKTGSHNNGIQCSCTVINPKSTDMEELWSHRLSESLRVGRHSGTCVCCDKPRNNRHSRTCSCGEHFIHEECVPRYRSSNLSSQSEDEVICVYCTCDICHGYKGKTIELACGCVYHPSCIKSVMVLLDSSRVCHFCDWLFSRYSQTMRIIPKTNQHHLLKLKRDCEGHPIFWGPWQISMIKHSNLTLEDMANANLGFGDFRRAGIVFENVLSKHLTSLGGLRAMGGIPKLIEEYYDPKITQEEIPSFDWIMDKISLPGGEKESELTPLILKDELLIEKDDLIKMEITCQEMMNFSDAKSWMDAYSIISVNEIVKAAPDFNDIAMHLKLRIFGLPVDGYYGSAPIILGHAFKPDSETGAEENQTEKHGLLTEEEESHFSRGFKGKATRLLND